jgi:type VI secretion system protein ImpG
MSFLDSYNAELRHLRQTGAQFAREHPHVASRLGLQEGDVTDPFVERLLEGVAYLTARVQTRLDAQGVELAQHALARLAPLFSSVTPAITTFAFTPDPAAPDSQRCLTVPRGTAILAQLPGRQLPVRFTTGQEVQIWPLRMSRAQCSRSLTDLPQTLATQLGGASALVRLSFQMEGLGRLQDLKRSGSGPAFERLRLTMAADEPSAFELQKCLLADTLSCWAVAEHEQQFTVLPIDLANVKLAGLESDEQLLPPSCAGLPGLALMREYFAQPSRFLGVDIGGLGALPERAPGARSFDLIFGLKRQPLTLMGRVDSSMFRLYASPAINLFPKRLDPLLLDAHRTEHWLPVERNRAHAHHLFELTDVQLLDKHGHSERLLPAVGARADKAAGQVGQAGHYLLKRRAYEGATTPGRQPDQALQGLDYLLLTPARSLLRLDSSLTVLCRGLVCDRGWRTHDLPAATFLFAEHPGTLSIQCLRRPSEPRPVPSSDRHWEAVTQLHDHPLAMPQRGVQDVAEALKQWLGLAIQDGEVLDEQRVASVLVARVSRRFARAGRAVPTAWTQSIHLELDIADHLHADHGGWLFGRVLLQALSEAVHLNLGFEAQLQVGKQASSRHSNLIDEMGSFS